MEEVNTQKRTRPGARGKPRLNRKRFQAAVKFLQDQIANGPNTEKGIERRMRAVALLLDIYDRADKAAERRAKKEAGAANQTEPTQAPEPVAAEETTDERLARLKALYGGNQ